MKSFLIKPFQGLVSYQVFYQPDFIRCYYYSSLSGLIEIRCVCPVHQTFVLPVK